MSGRRTPSLAEVQDRGALCEMETAVVGGGVSNEPRSASTDRLTPLVSVLIPTLDEAGELPHLLDHLAALHGHWETIVADGGSRDATRQIAADHSLKPRVIEQPGGRAAQLNAAARAAGGDVLLFLHADSRLPRDAYASLAEASRAPGVRGGNFALRFGDDGRGGFERLLGAIYRLQRRHGLYYGDSSIWVTRESFDALGGFREIAIMDDYDFVRRLEHGPGATRCLPGPATTSARRWRRAGIARTVLAWFVIRRLYVAGVPPHHLARLYRAVR
jgi:rSAM/selenodomain-associated transferase 2